MPLTDIQTHYLNSNKDVLLTWKSEPTDLQPINEYVVVVSSASFVSSVEPRQKKDDLSSVVEYSTPWTYFLIEGLDQQQSITVHVCAENDLGRTCTEPPLNLSFVELTSPKEIKDQEETGLELKYLIPIIVLPILLAVLCFVLLLVAVVICVCAKSRSKHYYPARQGNSSKLNHCGKTYSHILHKCTCMFISVQYCAAKLKFDRIFFFLEQRMESSRQSFAEGRCVNQPAIIVTCVGLSVSVCAHVHYIGCLTQY